MGGQSECFDLMASLKFDHMDWRGYENSSVCDVQSKFSKGLC